MLSGGGARGIAHVGVLKVLEELHVPVDAIAGTSMGAVAGGLYASGMSAQEIEQLVSALDWAAAFRDRPERSDLDFRRKQDDKEFLVRLPLGLKGGDFHIPRGLVQGQKLNQILRRETLSVAQVRDFDQLPVRFRAVATDLETGEPTVLGEGDLVAAMRASMSAPGLFAPVELGGRLLTDGGVSNNLPVDAARAMGVDVLIVVDVSYPPQPRSELNSALSISNQAIALMMRRESARQRELLGSDDVILAPELGTLGSVDFTRVAETLQRGEQAARRQADRLRALAVDDATWNSYLAARAVRTRPLPDVQFVRVDEASQRYARRIEATMAPLVGAPLDSARLERGMSTLYGDDIFEILDYRLVRDGDASGLEFSARRKSWGPNYVRFGLQLQDDFEGGSSFNAGVRFLVTELNGYGAEWRTDLQIGANPRLATELYQPLGYASKLFVSPHLLFEQHKLTIYEDGSPLAEYRVRNDEFGVDLGREIGLWGELRAGLLRGSGSQRLRVGIPAAQRIPQDEDFDRGEALLRFSMDRMDNVFFPRHGESFTLEWRGGRDSLGSDQDYDRYRADWLFARSRGRHTLMLWATAETITGGGQQPLANYSSLGGLFNLSGLPQQSLTGPHIGIGRALVFRRIGKGGEGFLNVPTYAGISAEYGNAWATREEASWHNARWDGSLFLGLDTLLGPVYFAAGFDERGESAFYLLLGRPL